MSFKKLLPIFLIGVISTVIYLALFVSSGSDAVFNYIFKDKGPLQSTDGKVNVLLLGNAGGIHDGATLTDTIMVASINLANNRGYFISLPRDLWVEEEKLKINAVYEYAGKKDGGALNYTKKIIGQILGIPIHYAVRVDFSGFTRAIDELGGVGVDVERAFDDYNYPIEEKRDDLCGWEEKEVEFDEEQAKQYNIEAGKRQVLVDPAGKIATDSAQPDRGIEYFRCRYEHISFKKGVTHMDGNTALKFVRSRMGTNGEGNDFARSKRQQKVLEAVKNQALSFETLTSPTKVASSLSNFGKSIETDISPAEGLEFYKLTQKITTRSFVIDQSGPEPLLINPLLQNYGGAWVLIPKGGDFTIVHQFVAKILSGEEEDETSAVARPRN